MPDDLTAADLSEARQCLAHALRFDRSGRATRTHADVMAQAAAEHVIEALRLSGFVLMRRPPAQAHTASTAFRHDHD